MLGLSGKDQNKGNKCSSWRKIYQLLPNPDAKKITDFTKTTVEEVTNWFHVRNLQQGFSMTCLLRNYEKLKEYSINYQVYYHLNLKWLAPATSVLKSNNFDFFFRILKTTVTVGFATRRVKWFAAKLARECSTWNVSSWTTPPPKTGCAPNVS